MIEALAWTGFVLMCIGNAVGFTANTVKFARGEYPLASVIGFWVVTVWFCWSCVHLLRFA